MLRKSGDTGEEVQPYSDVKEGEWFYDSVTKLQALSAIPESELFYPDEYITRRGRDDDGGQCVLGQEF